MLPALTPFAFAAPQRRIERHAIAHFPAFDPGTDLIDHASDVRSADMRQLQGQPRQTPPDPQVEVVEGCRSYRHHHRSRRRNRLGRLTRFHDLWSAVPAEESGVHRVVSLVWAIPADSGLSPGAKLWQGRLREHLP